VLSVVQFFLYEFNPKVHFCTLSSQFTFLGHNLRLANTELLGIWSSGQIKQATFDRLRSLIAGSYACEDVLKKQSKTFCYRLFRKWTSCKRNLNHLKRKYSTWLTSHTEVCINRRRSIGRQAKIASFVLGARAQRKVASNLIKSTSGNIKLLINSASAAVRKAGNM